MAQVIRILLSRRESLLDFLNSNSLRVVNVGDEPAISNKVRQEVIGITISAEYIPFSVSEWHAWDEASTSDNFYILWKIHFDSKIQT